ncbi:MAG: ABC transporter ATP-binding protein/permease [Lachnospiraceae bacterium]|nr:ABC transporter ATP-binding protein/permease [Lachnospiraceae bacterium]
MLQIKNISKEYKTGTLVQKALNHVSLSLRDNEFVAILGPSGSGKTTLLNIIGGLDRYDTGDLIINGISTRKYKDRDWDSYRNHTIGFVFQSYNLIPHQTVLSNVELALTIGGISKAERRKRAAEALTKVGLGDQLHKKPNQMSGGQMQRVAIARALVNDPDILLADEPTGALDSETSLQVMDLLKEVARDRLVVMVTHNPELAHQYATRIVTLKDGVIIGDSDPYEVTSGETVHRNFGRSSMSFLTALSLSFNNLKTKLARTLLISLAGSIGITGIALILSLSNGVNQYIHGVEEETLSEYPIEISNASFDLTSFMGTQAEAWHSDAEVVEWRTLSNMLTKISSNDLSSLQVFLNSPDSGMEPYVRAVEYKYSLSPEIYRLEGSTYYQVNPDSTFSQLGFTSMSSFMSGYSSDSFMALPEEESLYLEQYDIKAGRWPQNDHELVVVLSQGGQLSDLTLYAMGLKDPDELESIIRAYMAGESADLTSPLGEYRYEDLMGLTFSLVHSCDYYKFDHEYKVWTNKTEDKRYMLDLIRQGETLTVVGVVQPKEDSNIAMLTTGIYYRPELIEDMVNYAAKSDIVKMQLPSTSYDIITGTAFGTTTDGSFNMQNLFSVDEDALANAITFDTSVMEDLGSAMDFSSMDLSSIDLSSIDLSSPDFSGEDMPQLDPEDLLDLAKLIRIDLSPEIMISLFTDLMADYQSYLQQSEDPTADITRIGQSVADYLRTPEASQVLSDSVKAILSETASGSLTEKDMQDALVAVVNGYLNYAADKGISDMSGLAEYLAGEEGRALVAQQTDILAGKLGEITLPTDVGDRIRSDLAAGYAAYAQANGLPDPDAASRGFTDWMATESVRTRILEAADAAVDTTALEARIDELMGAYEKALTSAFEKVMTTVMTQVASDISYAITNAMSSLAGSLENALSIDADAFARAFKVTMTQEELSELMAVMMTRSISTYEGNLSKMGYADLSKPTSITIYPKDFASKASIKEILDAYNDRMRENGEEEKVVTYTDIVGTLMTSVTDIINAISYVLVAFVAISLVVSSIMIGVITYISVLERKKEIGILRAIGASKKNISAVFNAETVIIGLLAGLIGVGGTSLLLIPGNMLIHYLTKMDSISAILPPTAGVLLIILSIFLTLLGGLIPSGKAAKSDPVTALRTE